jgi:hypothetical protein
MAEPEPKDTSKRDRSPKFPYIGLSKALERIQVLYDKVKRYDARIADIAKDWGLSATSSSTDRTVAALQSFGLIDDSGSGENRKIKLTELAVRILADQRPGVREGLLSEAALKPPIISDYARKWTGGRPDETHALGQLQFDGGFTEEGAKMFLRVFDDTIKFTKESVSDKLPDTEAEAGREKADEGADSAAQNQLKAQTARQPLAKGKLMDGERELTTGMLSKAASFRLIVSGDVGVKEIDRLIAKLELDKEILAEDVDISTELEQ